MPIWHRPWTGYSPNKEGLSLPFHPITRHEPPDLADDLIAYHQEGIAIGETKFETTQKDLFSKQ